MNKKEQKEKAKKMATHKSKLYPRIRMISNGDNKVNKVRSDRNSTVVFSESKKMKSRGIQQAISNSTLHIIDTKKITEIPKKERKKYDKGKRLNNPPREAYFNVFVTIKTGATPKELEDEIKSYDNKSPILKELKNARAKDNIYKFRLNATDLELLCECKNVVSIEGSQSLMLPPINSGSFSTANKPPKHNFLKTINKINKTDNKILVGIIDVGGFDFAHPDFINEHGTKFHSIWDQKKILRKSPNKIDLNELKILNTDGGVPNKSILRSLNYGSVITASNINQAIQDSESEHIPIHTLEPQSQQNRESHATHVASIAAGNSGVCPDAYIIGVSISTPNVDEDRRSTFTDSSRLADAVDYIVGIAEIEDLPVSINISLGTNGHAHDGSSPVNRWIDSVLTKEGRALCVAAGNSGQEKAISDDDFGYAFGRIHTSGKIEKANLFNDLEWEVIGNGNVDISENELEIWYGPQDRFSVSVKPPDEDWIGPVKPQQVVENLQLKDKTFLSVYNSLFYKANGSNHIAIYLSPYFGINENDEEEIIGIKSGTWKVRLIADEVRNGKYNAWIERDGFSRYKNFWQLPSFFSENTNVDNSSINSLACGQNVIAVGNYDTATEKINITSSQGPTRDNRPKPEIISPGTDIVAANGFKGPLESDWVKMTGTSMASPFVCGVAALLLQRFPHLTSAQIGGILKRTSDPLPNIDFDWKDDIGYGIINPVKALRDATKNQEHEDITEKLKKKR